MRPDPALKKYAKFLVKGLYLPANISDRTIGETVPQRLITHSRVIDQQSTMHAHPIFTHPGSLEVLSAVSVLTVLDIALRSLQATPIVIFNQVS